MSDIPGVTILSETSNIINHPIGDYHANFLSILCFVAIIVLFIIGASIFSKTKYTLLIIGSLSIGIIGAILFLTGLASGYEWREDKVIKYEITIDETTPYLALQKYNLIKEENGIYTFETQLPD